MTYGPSLKWRFPFQEKLELRKLDFRVVFITLCLVVVFIVSVSFSYYSSLPVSLTQSQLHHLHVLEVDRIIISNISKRKVASSEDDETLAKSEVTTKQIEKVFSKLNLNIVKLNYTETNIDVAEIDSDSYDADDNSNTTLAANAAHVQGINWNDTRLDILHMPKKQYDTKFKNPCWYEPLANSRPYENNTYAPFSPSAKRVLAKMTEHWEEQFDTGNERNSRLRCLPYFLIIGQPKCGTTDLFWKIAQHPDIEAPPIKELHWWSRSRQGRRFSYSKIIPFNDYVDMFDRAALHIEQRLHNLTAGLINSSQESYAGKNSAVFETQKITGEASVSLFWDNNDWMKFPENLGQREPLYIVPHYIRHIIPDTKLIIMLRNPVERMYSDYLYFHSTNKSPDDFHSAVDLAIRLYSNCTSLYSVRQCVYDTNLANKVRVRLRVGMYSVYFKDWLRLFPLKQFFVLRLEDYSKRPVEYVKQIYRFLQIRDVTKEEEELVCTSPGRNARKPEDKLLGGMHEKTRSLLKEFYQPFNQELARMLGHTKFLWSDKKH
ncbi:carbohydrate sulfotransferase 15-like [Ruditapes philippinarum]|uniref:carbohydrate sulfotransferase 15-like n=1 Tax=Ruditapes philippinarum TaxID=129788 RepID=UPI00295A936C|nr:carbohydrate sulfotransferase 15-like [Ruditapes philippinarum]XP_060570880.1 carbohydrate sulfotransferase 15-like [Ruditapes philippinarum]XP_060570881.1 carbohydrate sulfotransferase 15-like [Ruditapes philippinarum]